MEFRLDLNDPGIPENITSVGGKIQWHIEQVVGAGGGVLIIPTGEYIINTKMKIKKTNQNAKYLEICGEGKGVLIKAQSDNKQPEFQADNFESLKFKNIDFDINYAYVNPDTKNQLDSGKGNGFYTAIKVSNVKDLRVENCRFFNSVSKVFTATHHAILGYNIENAWLRNNEVSGMQFKLSTNNSSLKNCVINNNRFMDSPAMGVSVVGDPKNDTIRHKNIIVANNAFDRTEDAGFYLGLDEGDDDLRLDYNYFIENVIVNGNNFTDSIWDVANDPEHIEIAPKVPSYLLPSKGGEGVLLRLTNLTDNVVISNNMIKQRVGAKSSFGVKVLYGQYNQLQCSKPLNVSANNNAVSNSDKDAIRLTNVQNASVSGNQTANSVSSVYCTDCDSIVVADNTVDNSSGGNAFRLQRSDTTIFAHNVWFHDDGEAVGNALRLDHEERSRILCLANSFRGVDNVGRGTLIRGIDDSAGTFPPKPNRTYYVVWHALNDFTDLKQVIKFNNSAVINPEFSDSNVCQNMGIADSGICTP